MASSASRPPEDLGPTGLALWRALSTDGKPLDKELLHHCREADRIDAKLKAIVLKARANFLQSSRQLLGMTVETVADLADVDPRRLEGLESGTEIPDEVTMDAVEAVIMPLLAEYLRSRQVSRSWTARDWALQHLFHRYG